MNKHHVKKTDHLKGVKLLFRTLLAVCLSITSFCGDTSGMAYADVTSPIAIVIENQPVVFTTKTGYPFIDENKRTEVPFRVVLEAFGASVTWEQGTQTAVAVKGDITVEIPIGQSYILKNGLQIDTDTKARIKEGRTYLPIRAVLKAFGAYVNWNPLAQKVEVVSNVGQQPVVTIEMESGQKMLLLLDPKAAPNTVNNFISLVEKGFYNGLTFHRVIADFMIQGGCPLGNGTGSPGYSIPGEFSANKFKNDLKHVEGVISMARSASPDSAGSQFFIMHKTSPFLDGQYAAFGRIVEGLDVVNTLATSATDAMDKPLNAMKMSKVTVETYGVDYPDPIVVP